MMTIRRTYLYGVAFISFHTILWSTVGLGHLLIDSTDIGSFSRTRLAALLSALIVAIPIYLVHWQIAQKLSRASLDERGSMLRGLYHYALMASTALPGLFAAVELLKTLLLEGLAAGPLRAFVTLIFAAAAWLYARRQVIDDQQALPEHGGWAGLRRLYRYVMVSAGLGFTVSGAASLLGMLLETTSVGSHYWRGRWASSLSLAIVGTPAWVVPWRQVQAAFLSNREEAESVLRKAFLYLVAFLGSITVIATSAALLAQLLQRLMGQPPSGSGTALSSMISAIVVGSAVWGYHGRVLASDAAAVQEIDRQAGIRRLYFYLLAAIGLGSTLAGVLMLVSVLSLALGGTTLISLRASLSNGIAALAAGLPLWLFSWSKMEQIAQRDDSSGEGARQSYVRRGYLYLAAFVGIVGFLVATAAFINTFLQRILGAVDTISASTAISAGLTSLVFAALLAYHLLAVRGDGRRQRSSRVAALGHFQLALAGATAWRDEIQNQLQEQLPDLQIQAGQLEQLDEILPGAQALLIPASALVHASQEVLGQIKAFLGPKVVVPDEESGWHWGAELVSRGHERLIKEIASLLEETALGHERAFRRPLGAWGTVGVVLLVIFSLMVLLPLLLSLLFRMLGFMV